MTKEEITALLATVVHPETDRDIVSSGMVCDLDVTDDKVRFVLKPTGRAILSHRL